MKPKLTDGVKFIIDRLNSHGERADVVGGSVRDFLLGKEPCDFDITTSATPEQMKMIFSDLRTIETGIKHGTLTVIYDGLPYEITTYREDGEYIDHRHPESVTFSKTIDSDLSRRDFTVNAIAYNERDGFTDLFAGREDIQNKIIRAVGDPNKRFDEDALRIMRAVRFSAVLGFCIEEKTATAASKLAGLLKNVSGERIYAEWKKLIGGEYAYDVIKNHSEIMREILGFSPLLHEKAAFYSASDVVRTLSLFAPIKDSISAFVRFAERLRTDSEFLKCGRAVLENISRPLNSLTDVNIAFSEMGEEHTRTLIELGIALGRTSTVALSFADKITEENLPYKISHLDINGEDVKAIGYVGKAVGMTLARLLSDVIFGKIKNSKSELVKQAKSYTRADVT